MNEKPLNKSSFDDAVFEGRNKEYGAYELRSRYKKRLLTAFSIAIFIVLIIIFYPKQEEKPDKKYTVDEISLSPIKKIKTPVLPEKEMEQPVEEKKEVTKPQEVVEKPKVNESKVAVVENKPTTPVEEPKKTTTQEVVDNGNNNSKPSNNEGNQTDEGPVDAESVTIPAVFPGCEKYTEKRKIQDCFGQKLKSEIQFYLDNEDWKKKSTERIYFEIDKQGNIVNTKFLGGSKINDEIALKTLKKIAMDFNKRTNPSRRIKPGKDAFGKVVTVYYSIPVSFVDLNVD